MRSNDKLPRGSFFYIQLGPKFYAGKAPVTTRVRTHATEFRPRYTTRHYKNPGEIGRIHRTIKGWQPNKPHCQPVLMASFAKGEVVTVHTGQFTNILVEVKDEAKQFRHLSKAETICAELAREYADLGVKPVIHTHRGDAI